MGKESADLDDDTVVDTEGMAGAVEKGRPPRRGLLEGSLYASRRSSRVYRVRRARWVAAAPFHVETVSRSSAGPCDEAMAPTKRGPGAGSLVGRFPWSRILDRDRGQTLITTSTTSTMGWAAGRRLRHSFAP